MILNIFLYLFIGAFMFFLCAPDKENLKILLHCLFLWPVVVVMAILNEIKEAE